MLYVQEKVAKLGNVYLGGQVTSVEIVEAGSIYVAQDDKGKIKKSQPVGYENAKINIDILLEDTAAQTTIDQLIEMQNIFKAAGQNEPQLLPIVNEDCAARGISNVYFKNLTSKKVISESRRIVMLELWAPDIATVKVTKLKNAVAGSKNNRTGSIRKSNSKSQSPARDTRDTSTGRKVAERIVETLKNAITTVIFDSR